MSGSFPARFKMGTNGKRKVAADVANLRQPISTTITGMKQAINVLNSGALEAKQVLLNEANVIYECKVCFSMFRSIANLIAHKRTFCRLKSKTALHVYTEEDPNDQDDQLVCVEQEEADAYNDPSTWNLDNHSPSMELIKTAGILEDLLASKYRPDELNPNKSILAVNKRLKALAEVAEKESYSTLRSDVSSEKGIVKNKPGKIVLEPVFNTTNAFFQSWKYSESEPTQKDLFSDWNSFKDNNNHVIVMDDNSAADNSNQQLTKQSSLEKRFPCCNCDQDYGSIFSLKRHYVLKHQDMHGCFDLVKEKIMKSAFYQDISLEISVKDNCSLRTPIKPLRINVSKKNITQAHLQDLEVQKSDRLENKEDIIPKHVEEKIMEYVNRRHVQCKECFKKFRTTKLVQQHVANEHLKFKRFVCGLCGFGSWAREHIIKHAANSHRKSNKDIVTEQDVNDYFVLPVITPSSSKKKLIAKSPGSTTPLKRVVGSTTPLKLVAGSTTPLKRVAGSTTPLKHVAGSTTPLKRVAEVRLSPVKLLHDNLINLDKKEKSPSNCSEQDSDTELLTSSVLTGLKDQIRRSIEEDPKPLLPLNGEMPVPVSVASSRPKRKRETSGCSCASSTQDEVSLKGLKSSPTLLLDTRAPSTRLKSPTKIKGEFSVKSKQKNCTKVRSKCLPDKSGDSKKVKRCLSK